MVLGQRVVNEIKAREEEGGGGKKGQRLNGVVKISERWKRGEGGGKRWKEEEKGNGGRGYTNSERSA